MTINASWEILPPEIWFMIMEKLSVKSQTSLACTCKAFYKLSLDPFLETVEQRAWIYLKAHKPLPDLLAQTVTILRIPAPQKVSPMRGIVSIKETEEKCRFIQEQIGRMGNLRMLILEKRPDEDSCFLSKTAVCELILQKDLDELKVPGMYLTHKSPTGKTLLHLAVEKGNTKLVDCMLFQMEVYFQQEGRKESTTFSQEVNLSDEEGYTPLKIAMEQKREELILLLLKKGARGKEYLLSKESTDLSPIMQNKVDKGIHLHVDGLSSMSFGAFFEAVAESRKLMTLSFSKNGYRKLHKKRFEFFQNLAEALKRNFQKNSASSGKRKKTRKSSVILLLDLSGCEGLSASEVQPLFTCPGLKELLLPRSLIDHWDIRNQNLLHLLVQEKSVGLSKEIAASFISQGVALTARDHQGHTPIQLAQAIGRQTGNQEMVAFLAQAARRKVNALAFGKKDWEKYCGKVGKEPPMSNHILEILESPCPIWPGKKVQDTHLLTLIPDKVDGKPLTLDLLQDLVKNPKGGGNKTDYRTYIDYIKNEQGSKPSGFSYWILMTKEVLPNTRGKSYDRQLAEFNALAAKALQITRLGEYQTPKALEAATSMLMEYVRRGVRLYSDPEGSSKQWTYTRCEETVGNRTQVCLALGGFDASGLVVDIDYWGYKDLGLGAVRKCFGR